MDDRPAVDFNAISYAKISTDWDIISLVISKEDIGDILVRAAALTIQGGESPLFMEATILDLESLCTLDYRQLPELTKDQVVLMEEKLSGETGSVIDMFFLELRCTITLGWKEPESNDDIRSISYHNSIFNNLIYRKANFLASNFGSNRYNMPYWLRLSQLRVMSHIPNKLINEAQLDEIFFFLSIGEASMQQVVQSTDKNMLQPTSGSMGYFMNLTDLFITSSQQKFIAWRIDRSVHYLK